MKTRKVNFSLYLFLFVFFLSSIYIDWWPYNWNTASRAALPLSIVLEGDMDIDEYAEFTGDKATINGHYYSDKGPGIAVLMTPVLFITDIVYPLEELEKEEQMQTAVALGAVLFGSLPFSLCVLLIFNLRFRDKPLGPALVILFFFGSFLFVFSGSFYSHAFAGFLLLTSAICLEKNKFLLGGLLIGLAFMTEYTLALFGAAMGLWLLIGHRKSLAPFILSAAIPILLQGAYNYALTGSVAEFAYKYQENFTQNANNYGFGLPSFQSLYDLSISPYRGLLFYAPMLPVLIIFAKWRKIMRPLKSLRSILLLTCLAYFLLFAMSKSWHGGWSFGPRYLYVLPPLLLYLLSSESLRPIAYRWMLFAGSFGLIYAFLDKATVLYPPTNISFPLTGSVLPAINSGHWNEWNLFSFFGMGGLNAFISFSGLFLVAGGVLSYWYWRRLATEKE